ncbi:MAG TPA: G/U mismatch-specific DNA glycosylase [Tepidisphaeraceae bacterium]|jgi:TDG/mug DNA glycosylase family protein|nr:G/U mismatch-specific DNA glycosylase [Tepidisphaeraceae bacterium]
MAIPFKPTKEQLAAAVNKTTPDLIGPNLKVLFVGINPGLYSAATGRHFARPGNRFWPALRDGGFTNGLMSPFDSHELLQHGYGITNICRRATVAADELTRDELIHGAKLLVRKIKRFKPRIVAILGVGSYRTAFNRPKAQVGKQDETIGESIVWVLPNPSGLNAHFIPSKLAIIFQELKKDADRLNGSRRPVLRGSARKRDKLPGSVLPGR